MTTDNIDRDVEGTLARHFVFDLPVGTRRSIDRRVTAAIAVDGRYLPRAARSRRRFAFTPRLLAGLGVAAIVLAGTAVAGGTLFDRLVGGAPMLEDVWDRATDIGQSVTDAGYTVTLERAAVDADRVWVGVSVTSAEGTADIWDMRMTDANDVVLTGGTGVGTGHVNGTAAVLFGFQVPDGVTVEGPFTLEVTALDVAGVQTPGTWHFTFDVP
jgi:hypothetical protein